MKTEVPSDRALATIAALAQRQIDAAAVVELRKQELALAEKALREVQEDLLPAAMQEAGLSKFTLLDGSSITVRPDISISLANDRKAEAYAWLEAHALGGVIKREVSVRFAKGEEVDAAKAVASLQALGFVPEVEQAVHAQTLKATIKEAMARGVDVPLDLFGVYPYSKAIIK